MLNPPQTNVHGKGKMQALRTEATRKRIANENMRPAENRIGRQKGHLTEAVTRSYTTRSMPKTKSDTLPLVCRCSWGLYAQHLKRAASSCIHQMQKGIVKIWMDIHSRRGSCPDASLPAVHCSALIRVVPRTRKERRVLSDREVAMFWFARTETAPRPPEASASY